MYKDIGCGVLVSLSLLYDLADLACDKFEQKEGNQLTEISIFHRAYARMQNYSLSTTRLMAMTSQSPQSLPDHDTPDQTPVRILDLCS